MVTPFEFFKPYVQARVPVYAVETQVYQAGPTEFENGLYFQVVDIGDEVCTQAEANALLAEFQALGYQVSGVSAATGSVVNYGIVSQPGTAPRLPLSFVGPNGESFDGTIQEYFIAQSAYNSVNGGGVGSPGAWTYPKGAFEPVWVPAVYVPPAA